ncbi:MAG TPA: TetR family transcriptional regulator [Jatrophihabitans sp.]|nr:TetR family transcriptional regulator [Jatrophihabitans sp.]
MPGSGAYRGIGADERRAQRRRLLIDSALDCLHQDGLAAVSVRSVCAQARLTARYFYENFADLDALLLAAVDTVLEEVADTALAAVVAAPPEVAARVRAAIDAGYGVVVSDRRKATALLVAGAGHGPMRERRRRMIIDFADVMIQNIALLRQAGLPDRAELRASALFVMGGSAEVIEAVLSGRLRMSRARVVDQLTALWLGALDAPSTTGG